MALKLTKLLGNHGAQIKNQTSNIVNHKSSREAANRPGRVAVGRCAWIYDLRVMILSGRSDANVSFDAMCRLLEHFGFEHRVRGGHHIFTKSGVEEIINLQPKDGKGKPYQVKQVRELIVKYKLEA